MDFGDILIVVSYVIVLLCPLAIAIFDSYELDLRTHVKHLVENTSLSYAKQNVLSAYFLTNKNSYVNFKKLPKIAKNLMKLLVIINSIALVYTPDVGIIHQLASIIMIIGISAIGIMFSTIIAEGIIEPKIEIKVTLEVEDLFLYYFDKEYPDISSILTPIYTQTKDKKYKHRLKSKSMKYFDREYQKDLLQESRFGATLEFFIATFEKALNDKNSESVFIAETLNSTNVSLLAKLIVILDDPLLISEIVDEESDISIDFNGNLRKLVTDISEKVENIQKIGKNTFVSEKTLAEHEVKQQAKERLNLLLKQNFDIIN